jgi:threonine/homoserine/homoserine lactone efflux protein
MQHSFSLGLLHGVLYGITPLTAWFIALKRYVFQGPRKGVYTFIGICFGQVLLVLLAFGGNQKFLWLWYYTEPILVMCGFMLVIQALVTTWDPSERPTPLRTRKEVYQYIGSGIFFAFCNPGGLLFGDLLVATVPNNTPLYLFSFLFMYSSVTVGLMYLFFFSPRAQEWFGPWKGLGTRRVPYQRDTDTESYDFVYYVVRVRNLRKLGWVTGVVLALQLFDCNDSIFWVYHVDTTLGMTPVEMILPKRASKWVEAELDEPGSKSKATTVAEKSEAVVAVDMGNENEIPPGWSDAYAVMDDVGDVGTVDNVGTTPPKSTRPKVGSGATATGKSTKMMNKKKYVLQSPIDEGLSFGEANGEEKDLNMDAMTPWDTVVGYNEWNEKLERDGMEDDWKELELKYYDAVGMNKLASKSLIASFHARKAPLWEGKNQRSYLKRLTEMRVEMDTLLEENYSTLPSRAFLPYTLKYEVDYDFRPPGPVEFGEEEITEEDVQALEELLGDPELWAKGYFAATYEMMHRGGVPEDFASVKMQPLPQEVHFPWDYPAIEEPNVPDIDDEADASDVARRNEVQNKNVWFLDPIALNTRFLANNPSPVTQGRWTRKTPADVPDIKAANTIRRWWLGKNLATREDAQSGLKTSPEETIIAKIIPGGSNR